MKPLKLLLIVLTVFIATQIYLLGFPRLAVPSNLEVFRVATDPRIFKENYRPDIRFSFIKTGEGRTLEAFIVEGGSLFKKRKIVHTAVLIEHPKGTLLFDSGLGTHIAEEFRQHAFYKRPLLAYKNDRPAINQLQEAGFDSRKIRSIFLSHLHWDHASGIKDFPWAKIYATSAEKDFASSYEGQKKGYIASQFSGREVDWADLFFTDGPYENYESSKDWFGDGSLVFVPIQGHTPGSVGAFLNLSGNRRYLFTGDTTWSQEGFAFPAHKPRASRWIADNDPNRLGGELEKIHQLLSRYPKLRIIPAHDATAQEKFEFFPNWNR
ncbi:metallo-beta-lactamase domain protein [Leptospira inadai serovar Lyme str. 10]|uniref:Metallo-beta-lactamase domain protein n=2 Tax=Leptospira inadai serovar Lyme TaxID=293084 RepID=V6HDT5_9LEPT|nr:MBL fold metallo-hydrolase [Leptospira inadai]EQA38346.1 metallo-beta-lactamase domain protein [Leptospira inadai serovar Lyme str. 10]PNV74442.1 Zn-dependent hydrolase [Leptospira inadai serovar Lyme]